MSGTTTTTCGGAERCDLVATVPLHVCDLRAVVEAIEALTTYLLDTGSEGTVDLLNAYLRGLPPDDAAVLREPRLAAVLRATAGAIDATERLCLTVRRAGAPEGGAR